MKLIIYSLNQYLNQNHVLRAHTIFKNELNAVFDKPPYILFNWNAITRIAAGIVLTGWRKQTVSSLKSSTRFLTRV